MFATSWNLSTVKDKLFYFSNRKHCGRSYCYKNFYWGIGSILTQVRITSIPMNTISFFQNCRKATLGNFDFSTEHSNPFFTLMSINIFPTKMQVKKGGVVLMDVLTLVTGFVVVALVSFALNIPLGLWRATTKKFSLSWFISIHLAVPLIYFLRVSQGLAYWTIPFFFAFAIFGQIAGGCLFNKYVKTKPAEVVYRQNNQEETYLFRLFWISCGILSLIIGILGIMLPLLPTTPFVLLAAALFAKSSTRLYNYLARNKYFGPMIISWQETRTIPPKAKIVSALFMSVSIIPQLLIWCLKIFGLAGGWESKRGSCGIYLI